MKRTLVGCAVAAALVGLVLGAVGLVLQNQADFSKGYVHDQLAEHKIVFTPVAQLLDSQKNVPCLRENAGRLLTNGKQAECYAKYQIGLDLPLIDNGKSYFEDHYAAYLLRLQVAEAVAAHPDDPATAGLVKQSTELSRKADDLLAGEAMRGLLLTAYAFDLLGERGGQAATVCFLVGGLLLLAAVVCLLRGQRGRSPAAAAS